MSETPRDDERGESYLEIQMDRSTIVLAALGLLVLVAAAFLLGSWFGSRGSSDAVAASASGEAAQAPPEEHDGEDVAAESGFGGGAVTARGAPPVGAVPAPSRGAAAPSGEPAVASEDVPAPASPEARPAARATAASSAGRATAPTKAAARTAPAAKTSAPAKPPAASAPPKQASAPGSVAGGWVIQVAAASSRAEADQLAERLRRKGYAVRVVEEGGYSKVQVGPFDTKPAAQAAEQRLKREEKLGTWLKRG